MLKDVWIYALPAEWDALGDGFNYTYDNAITGYWLSSGLYEVYNVQAELADIELIVAALTDVQNVFAWDYAGGNGTGYDSLDAFPTDPAPILALMKPHVVYDENGDEVSSTPATFDTPNWGHVFLGQGQRVFAGDFSDEFSTEFF